MEKDQYTCVTCGNLFLIYVGLEPKYCPFCGQLTIRWFSTENLQKVSTAEKILSQTMNPYFKEIQEAIESIQQEQNKHAIH